MNEQYRNQPFAEPNYATPPGYAYNPPLPRKRRKWPLVVAIVALLILGACALGSLATGGAAKEVHNQTVSRASDVKMTSCKADEYGLVEVQYTITNSASVSETYMPHFQFQDASGAVIGDAYDISSSVAPGKVYKGKAEGSISGDLKTCSVVGS